jgi:predicted TPR repeat methyltransferase
MKRLDRALLEELSSTVSDSDRTELAIPSYLHRNPLMREMAWARVERLARRLEREAERRRIRRVVDYGCGSGVLLEHASRLADEVLGIDLVLAPAKLLVQRRALSNVEIAGPERLGSLDAGSVDVILAGEVLEHVQPLAPLFAEMQRALVGNGLLLASLPTENTLYRLGRRLAGFSGHYHHDNARSIDAALRRSTFTRTYRSSIPLPGPLAIYWILEYRRDGAGGDR